MRILVKSTKLVLCLFVLIFGSSCQKDQSLSDFQKSSNDNNQQRLADEEFYTYTLLGEKLENPYSTRNMSQAYYNLTGERKSLPTTHYYVRFLPDAQWKINILKEQNGLELFDYPLDYEIIKMGDFYADPKLDFEDYHWLYTWVPANYVFTRDIRFEKLESLYLPDELSSFQAEELGINADELDYEALKIAGEFDGLSEEETRRAKKGYKPKGRIKIEDTELGVQGVKQVRVMSKRWFNIDWTYTNDNGDFEINRNYRRKADIIVVFKNKEAKIRGIRGFRLWQMFYCVTHNLGQFKKDDLRNVNYTYRRDNQSNNTESQRRWAAATVLNAVRDAHIFSDQKNIPRPLGVNIWLTDRITKKNSLAPMLNRMALSSMLNKTIDLALLFVHPAIPIVKEVLEQYLPDVTYNYNRNINSNELESDIISQEIYHVLANTIHYDKVKRNYWATYLNYMILHGGVGKKSSFGSSRIALAEAWGEHFADNCAHLKYPAGSNSIGRSYLERLENFNPNSTTDNENWIPDGIMYDMGDNGEPSGTNVRDGVRDYTMKECYNAMDVDVKTVEKFCERALQENSNKWWAQVVDLFEDYGHNDM